MPDMPDVDDQMADDRDPEDAARGDVRDRQLHADRKKAAASPLDSDRGASRLPEGPTVAPGNKGWDAPEAEAPESLEGAVRRSDDPQNGAPIYPGSRDDPWSPEPSGERDRADTAAPAIADDSARPDESGSPAGDDLGAGAD